MEGNNTTIPTSTAGYGESDCDTYKVLDYEIGLIILSVVMGLFGLVYTFVGYRCFKAVMFLSGFIFGGTVVYIICTEEKIVNHNLSFSAIIGISIGIGVLCGLITMLVVYVGLFLQGFFVGLLIAIGAILALSKFYHPSTPWIPVGILFGTGIIFTLLTLKWQKTFLIIGTSIMGSALVCSCVQYFLGKFSLHSYIWVNLMAENDNVQCWFFPIVLGLWPAIALLGIIIQWKFTSKGYDHTDVIIWREQGHRIRTHLVRSPHTSTEAAQRRRQRTTPSPRSGNGRNRRQRTEVHRIRETRSRPTNPTNPTRESAPPARNTQTNNIPANYDTLPPSYDDCVIRGVGKPIDENDQQRIVRTKHGSFLAPQDNPSFTGTAHSSSGQTNNSVPGPSSNNAAQNFVPGRRRRRTGSGSNRRSSSGSNQNRGARRSGRRREGGERAGGRNQNNAQPASSRARPRAGPAQSNNRYADDTESLLRT